MKRWLFLWKGWSKCTLNFWRVDERITVTTRQLPVLEKNLPGRSVFVFLKKSAQLIAFRMTYLLKESFDSIKKVDHEIWFEF